MDSDAQEESDQSDSSSDQETHNACENPYPVGHYVRAWRSFRGMTQEALARESCTTSRYISFIENGRATPSRAMLERIRDALDMDFKQGITLVEAAGYLPNYPVDQCNEINDEDSLICANYIVQEHMPNPGVVTTADGTIFRTNPTAERLLRRARNIGDAGDLRGINLIEMIANPNGLRPLIENWQHYMWWALDELHTTRRYLGYEPGVLAAIRDFPDVLELERLLEPPECLWPRGVIVINEGETTRPYLQLRSRIGQCARTYDRALRVELFFDATRLSE